MFKNYFKIAFRNLLNKKFYSAINILGLSIGMACCMLIFLYVSHELSYDSFHSKANRIYRLVTDIKTPTEIINISITSAPMGTYLKKDFPEVSEVARIDYSSVLLQKDDQQFQEDESLFADASFFEVFDFPLLRGNASTALAEPFNVVLTEDAAKKYFGKQDPIGQSLRMDGNHDVTVTGVVGNVPSNSQIQFSMLISMSTLTEKLNPGMEEEWGNFGFYTFLLLSEPTNPTALEAKIPAFMEQHIGPFMKEYNMHYSLFLEPLRSVYLHSDRGGEVTGNLANIYIFSIIAGFILLIACINFMNLATARATERAKEVGIRKVIGAMRRQLTLQFLSESILLSLIAFVLASLFCELLLPAFNQLSGKIITESIFQNSAYLLLLFLLALGVGTLAGIYPAFVLSSFKPVAVLKGRFSSSSRGLLLRKGLVIIQFTISIMLIAGTAIVYTQLDYMRSQGLGFKKEQMLVIDFKGDEKVKQQLEAIKNTLSSHPQVLSVSASSSTPSSGNAGAYTNIESPAGEMQASNIDLYSIDFDFLSQYQIDIVAGRAFSKDFPTDSTQALIINEAAAANYGYASPEEAVGKRFSQWGREGQIIGVIKNFHIRSLQQDIKPLTLRIEPNDFRLISFSIDTKDIPNTLASLEQQWKELAPQRPFDYFFLDDAFDQQYRTEVQFGQLFIYFAGLAIFIACLGLLGLISYTVVQRMREIGIRKVLGATEKSIVGLLSKDFLVLVVIAFIIATPIAWFVLKQWLEDFAYRIEISGWPFALAGMVAIFIAMLTVSFQSIRAALSNPVDSLRNE